MPLSLDQYADYLDTRRDLTWPVCPAIKRPKARPRLAKFPGLRAVIWNVYGTLLGIPGGALWFEHPQKFVMELALEKTIQEFKMWAAMTRKPGLPSEYMAKIYSNVISEMQLLVASGERFPELPAHKIWENIIKKRLKREYSYKEEFYGSLDEYCEKIAYFFHASLQGTACYEGAARAVGHIRQTVGLQGLLANGQCFTGTQLLRGLKQQGASTTPELFSTDFQVLSFEFGVRKPATILFAEMVARLGKRAIAPKHVLHIGSSITNDVAPARSLGMKTALFAGDKESLQATQEQLNQHSLRPDVLITELEQLVDVVA